MARPKQTHGGRGKPYTPRVIAKALSLIKENKKKKYQDQLTLQEVADRVGVRSPQTISNWIKTKQIAAVRKKKAPYLPHNRLLTVQQEAIVAGFITLRSINFFSTATRIACLFIHEHFGESPNRAWMSKWASRCHLSWRKVQRRTTNKAVAEIKSQIQNFLNDLQEQSIEPKRIICIDKTYLRTQALQVHELAPIGRYVVLRTQNFFEITF